MTADRQQFGLALGLSAGVNLLLLLFLAWMMAVSRGLNAGRANAGLIPPAMMPEALPEVVSIVLAPEEETSSRPERQYVNSPPNLLEEAPDNPAARFISSVNMRAASENGASPAGIDGMPAQEGLDKPFLDLRDSDFSDGSRDAPPPPTAQETNSADPVATIPATAAQNPRESPGPPERDIIPPPALLETVADTPPERQLPATSPQPRDVPVEPQAPAPAAFRDPVSQNLIPLPEKPAPRARPSARPTPPARAAVATRDRNHDPVYTPGTRKSRSLGKVTNKGPASVDALATPEGRFGRIIRGAVEKSWRRRMLSLSGLANPGLVEVEFEVDSKGRVSNVRLANPGEANPVMQDCALSAVIDAKLPPPPPELMEDLRDSLSGSRMRCSFTFLIY